VVALGDDRLPVVVAAGRGAAGEELGRLLVERALVGAVCPGVGHAELLQQARDRGAVGDAREAVWIIVRPLIESIDAGEMFVPFLARVSANPRTFAEYPPPEVADSTAGVLREMLPDLMAGMPGRARLGREVQLYNSVHSLLAELGRGHQRISEAQLNNYVDGWVGMLTAPMSPATSGLMGRERAG